MPFNLDFQQIVFLALGFVAVVASIMTIIQRNAIYSALFLAITFFQLAAIYVLLGAEFLAVLQVLVYTGAILVLFLFVVMLLQLREGPQLEDQRRWQPLVAWPLGLLLAGELVAIIFSKDVYTQMQRGISNGAVTVGQYTPANTVGVGGNVQAVGRTLYTDYIYPFEIASLILLIAVVGAIILSKQIEPESERIIPSTGISIGRTGIVGRKQGEEFAREIVPAIEAEHGPRAPEIEKGGQQS
jgi:NADH-quinone oxidoreductase subunit J